jgi:dihydroorotate dehydrogenase electron transfer subunit
MREISAKILENRRLGQNYYKLRIKSPYLAKSIRPGQFLEVRCSDGLDPLLRRPFSVHRILKDGVEILYEIVGRGTELLSLKKQRYEVLNIIGPLGNGFDMSHTAYSVQRTAILIGGGIGVAPLVALAEKIAFSIGCIAHRKKKKGKIHVLIGAKTKSHILCEKDFQVLGCDVKIATEDGSKGYKGLVTALLKEFLRTTSRLRSGQANHLSTSLGAGEPPLDFARGRRTTIYACGPNAMLREVAKIAKAKGAACQVSLEEHMACGVGVCLGCPVKVKTNYPSTSLGADELPLDFARRRRTTPRLRSGQANDEYKMVCKDGPVFDAEEIVW